MENKKKCPKCGVEAEHETAIRQGKAQGVSVADVGWRCKKCGHEFGFEYFTKSLALTIRNLPLEEVKELMRHVRGIEQETPDRLIFCWIQGLEHKTQKEVKKILEEIFPRVQVGG